MTQISLYRNSRSESAVESVEFETCAPLDCAQPTSRCLSGTQDHWAKEEWAEPVRLADGRTGTRYYLFDENDVVDEDGEPLETDMYDWSAEHCVGIVLGG